MHCPCYGNKGIVEDTLRKIPRINSLGKLNFDRTGILRVVKLLSFTLAFSL